MNLTRLKSALAKSKDIATTLLVSILSRTRVEPIYNEAGEKGVRTSWVGNPGENHIHLKTASWNADVKIESPDAAALEYVKHGKKQHIALKNIKALSCELDPETLNRLNGPKGAAFAVCIGAAIGLIGWLAISTLRFVTVQETKKRESQLPR